MDLEVGKTEKMHLLQILCFHLKQKQTKQTTRTGTEPQKWRSHGGLSTGEWEGERGGKGTEISSINGR